MCYEPILDLTTCLHRLVRPHDCEPYFTSHRNLFSHSKTFQPRPARPTIMPTIQLIRCNVSGVLCDAIHSYPALFGCAANPSERLHELISPMRRGPTNSITRSNSSCDLQILLAISPAVRHFVTSGSRLCSAANAFQLQRNLFGGGRHDRSNENKISYRHRERAWLVLQLF